MALKFNTNQDIFEELAIIVRQHGLSADNDRKMIKEIFYKTFYGQTAKSMANELNISELHADCVQKSLATEVKGNI